MIGLLKKTLSIYQSGWKEISKHTFSNFLSPLGVQNKDLRTASQMLLTDVKLLLRRRLYNIVVDENYY